MTLNINELREKITIKGLDVVADTDILAALDRLEAAEKERDALRADKAILQQMTYSLKDRLEVVEKERDDVAQQLVQSEIGKREISEAHDALQVEVGKLKDLEVSRCVKINGYIVDNARLAEEVERLQAKIEQMERQEPYSYIYEYANPIDGSSVWRDTPGYWNAQYPRSSKPLYALPGAQNVPSVPIDILYRLGAAHDACLDGDHRACRDAITQLMCEIGPDGAVPEPKS